MRNNIKISFEAPEYIVNESAGMVICKLKFLVNVPSVIHFCSKIPFHENPVCTVQTVKTVVFAKNNDVFDVNIGKKVALAKAENKAYSYTYEFVKSTQKPLANALDVIEDFRDKCQKVKAHNIEYMKKF